MTEQSLSLPRVLAQPTIPVLPRMLKKALAGIFVQVRSNPLLEVNSSPAPDLYISTGALKKG